MFLQRASLLLLSVSASSGGSGGSHGEKQLRTLCAWILVPRPMSGNSKLRWCMQETVACCMWLREAVRQRGVEPAVYGQAAVPGRLHCLEDGIDLEGLVEEAAAVGGRRDEGRAPPGGLPLVEGQEGPAAAIGARLRSADELLEIGFGQDDNLVPDDAALWQDLPDLGEVDLLHGRAA